MRKTASILLIAILTVSCSINAFIHRSVPIQEQIILRLEEISKLADEAVALKIFTRTDRQEFAKQVMVPAINANKSYALCLRDGNCSDLPEQLVALGKAFQVGIDLFVSRMAVSSTTSKLAFALSSALTLVNALKVGR